MRWTMRRGRRSGLDNTVAESGCNIWIAVARSHWRTILADGMDWASKRRLDRIRIEPRMCVDRRACCVNGPSPRPDGSLSVVGEA